MSEGRKWVTITGSGHAYHVLIGGPGDGPRDLGRVTPGVNCQGWFWSAGGRGGRLYQAGFALDLHSAMEEVERRTR
jgi:hypothetical protein